VSEIATELDLLLVMTVNPGFGGQQFIPYSVDKVRRARQLLDEVGSRAWLQVDGGIGRDTIGDVWRAGANAFVAGNAIFGAANPAAEIEAMRACCRVVV
jgi:ribulose-phosphate 3-epimerase